MIINDKNTADDADDDESIYNDNTNNLIKKSNIILNNTMNELNKSLDQINPFKNKKLGLIDKTHTHSLNVYIIKANDLTNSDIISMNLKEILLIVKNEIKSYDSLNSLTSSSKQNKANHLKVDSSTISLREDHNHKHHVNRDDLDYQATSLLHLRDLRRLDFQINPLDAPNILVRRHVVLISFDPLRAIVMADRLIMIVPDGADSILQILENYINEWNDCHDNRIAFETHAYEAILTTVNSLQNQDFNFISKQINEILSYTKNRVMLPVKIEEKMRLLKNSILSMKSRILGHKRVILELLEDDEDMALMNLSKLKYNPEYYKMPLVNEFLNSHEDIEALLESYLMDYNSLESKIESLIVQIQSAEELILLRLDTSRNELMVVQTSMAILSVAIGFSCYATGLFGMNLDNTITFQPTPGLFLTILCVTFVLIYVIFALIMYYYYSIGVLPKRVNIKKIKLD